MADAKTKGGPKAAKARARADERLPTEALRHGREAFGARYVREGFSFTPEQDLAFALGHGSQPRLGFGPMTLRADADVSRVAKLRWPDAVFHRNVAIHVLRTDPDARKKPPSADAHAEPIGEDEARAILKREFPKGVFWGDDYRALEAMVGPTCVLDGLVDGLEHLEDNRFGAMSWDNNTLQPIWAVIQGLLLRVPTQEHEAARTQLEALWASKQERHGARYLDILLHGVEGIVRSGYKYSREQDCYRSAPGSSDPASTFDLMFLHGEPGFVEASFEALWSALEWKPQQWMIGPSSSRLFFLGGPRMLDLERRVVGAYPKTMQDEAFESYREIRSSDAARLILRLTRSGSAVEKSARGWFGEKASWARPLLDQWAGSTEDPDAALAADVLRG